MLLKAGVDISRLNREIRRTLKVIDAMCEKEKQEVIVTSTYEGNHSPSSLHYSNDAIDIRYIHPKDGSLFAPKLRQVLGSDFDIIEETSHIHIEYDP